MNWLAVPTFLLAMALFEAGYRVGKAPMTVWKRALLLDLSSVIAIPAVLFIGYYLHVFPMIFEREWYYEFRALPFIELTPAFLGFGAGLVPAWIPRIRVIPRLLSLAATAALVCAPHMKPIIAPLDLDQLRDEWVDDVCMQTGSTCGPACAATLLRNGS